MNLLHNFNNYKILKYIIFSLHCKNKGLGHNRTRKPESQQQMAHMDFAVNDLEEAVQYAIHCGSTIAEEQFTDD